MNFVRVTPLREDYSREYDEGSSPYMTSDSLGKVFVNLSQCCSIVKGIEGISGKTLYRKLFFANGSACCVSEREFQEKIAQQISYCWGRSM
jgi:hypothetical protein